MDGFDRDVNWRMNGVREEHVKIENAVGGYQTNDELRGHVEGVILTKKGLDCSLFPSQDWNINVAFEHEVGCIQEEAFHATLNCNEYIHPMTSGTDTHLLEDGFGWHLRVGPNSRVYSRRRIL
jgi:hypothetical protein